MQVDIASFTPWPALLGGILIGLAAALLYLGVGRIAGVSGIFGKLVCDQAAGSGWRFAFLTGLILSAPLWNALGSGAPPAFRLHLDNPLAWAIFCVAGLAVGFGSRMANGCTSGHGICGLARFSRRSLLAVLTFMTAGMVAVYLVRHWLGD